MEGGSDGLILETQLLEPHRTGNVAQRGLGQPIGGGVVIDKMHGPPENGLIESAPAVRFCPLFEGGDELSQQITKANGAPLDFGNPVNQAAAQEAFEGTHQPSLIALKVVLKARPAEADRIVFGIEENDREQGWLAIFKGEQRCLLRPQPANG